MEKKEVLDFFGGLRETSTAMKLTESAVRQWPDMLPDGLSARVIGTAIVRRGLSPTQEQWPALCRKEEV